MVVGVVWAGLIVAGYVSAAYKQLLASEDCGLMNSPWCTRAMAGLASEDMHTTCRKATQGCTGFFYSNVAQKAAGFLVADLSFAAHTNLPSPVTVCVVALTLALACATAGRLLKTGRSKPHPTAMHSSPSTDTQSLKAWPDIEGRPSDELPWFS